MKKIALCLCLLIYPSDRARASTITFDDGTAQAPIGTFYSSLGIVFSNASWGPTLPIFQIGGSTGLLLEDVTDNGFNPPYTPTATNPIVGLFSSPQDVVSILGVDVGSAGIELDAYDALSGGNLIGSDQFFGTGAGGGTFQTLSVSAPGILRFQLFQPAPNSIDGVAFDNLTFSDSSASDTSADIGIEPAAWILVVSGFVALLGLKFWTRRRALFTFADRRPEVNSL